MRPLVHNAMPLGAPPPTTEFCPLALTVSDITEDENGLLVHVCFSKTKPRRPAVLRGQVEATCPVRTWKRWQEASARSLPAQRSGASTGPAACSAASRARLSARSSVAPGSVAGLDLKLTGHSVRAGLATEARRAGHDFVTIARQGG
ncbi:hypothetical protein K1T35_47605 (plasmid) [Pseudonocardia sp. DSM 110487]|uniref:hypothetical protein n=1 Tax=Pseudonocardia sp. DSM 110487 TaxID=2865833 RepID=UPI001C6991EA|nr:hypothetical protein [Pseudonocardia sp. DSM 110487]QYN41017.1 hypothetical protein K1T35_47605 [Pseudonocardia sp. DSM 110487]